MQVEAGMCRKSRDGQNTAKTDAKCGIHRKTPKKTMRNGELSMFLDSAARRLWHFFATKHRKYRRENKTQVQFRASKAPTLEFQHMPAKKSTHPARRQTHVLLTTTTTATAATRASSNSSKSNISDSYNYSYGYGCYYNCTTAVLKSTSNYIKYTNYTNTNTTKNTNTNTSTNCYCSCSCFCFSCRCCRCSYCCLQESHVVHMMSKGACGMLSPRQLQDCFRWIECRRDGATHHILLLVPSSMLVVFCFCGLRPKLPELALWLTISMCQFTLDISSAGHPEASFPKTRNP